MIRLMVTGDRDATGRDYKTVCDVLGQIHSKDGISELIHGACGHIDNQPGVYRGIDGLAHQWACEQKIPVTPFPADWYEHGKAAGPIRNAAMVQASPDLVVAFYGGRGTADAVAKAKLAGIPVREFKREGRIWVEIQA